MNALPRWQAFRTHKCKCPSTTLTDDARLDPTDTGSLRAAFVRDLSARWALLKRLVQDAAPVISGTKSPPSVANWLGIDRAGPFASWFEGVLERTVLEHDGAWMQPYLEKAVRQADKRAEKLGGMPLGSSGFSSQLATLQSVAVSELKGICAAVLQQSTREAATLALAAKSPDAIARAILGRIDALGQSRSEQMAEYLVIKTFSLATLASFKAAGHKFVGTIPETKQPVPAAAGKPVAAASSVAPIRSAPPKPVAPSVPTETPEQAAEPETTSRGKEAAVALGLAALAGLSGGVLLSKPMPKWQAAAQRRGRGAGTSSEAPHVAELEQMAKEGTVPPVSGEILPPLSSARTEPERPEPPVIEGTAAEMPTLPWGEAATMVNVKTMEDDKVCLRCLEIAANGPYDIDTAGALIPAHLWCRCSFTVAEPKAN